MQGKEVQPRRWGQNNRLEPEQAAERLREFVEGRYMEEDPWHQEYIDLKLAHSYRVWANVHQIALAEKITPEIVRLAEISALYHDVGRFPQYKKYRTFKDGLSENHGRLGLRVLRQTDLLRGLDRQEAKVVMQSVFLHNRAGLPPGLPRALGLVLMLVRDGDKLDIVQVIADHLVDQGGGDSVLTMGLTDNPRQYSPKILDQVREGSLVNYEDMVWVNDFKLLLCSWAFALSFAFSRHIMGQQGAIEHLLDSMPHTQEISNLHRKIMHTLGT
jgi:hypothetical protein